MSLFAYIDGAVVWARDIAQMPEKERERIKGRFKDATGERMKFMPRDKNGRRPHFSHVDTTDSKGESLSHLLFKLALARMAFIETDAQFKGRPLGRIPVSRGVYEYPVWCHGRRRPLRIDVVFSVREAAGTFIGQWGPLIGVEVECKHATEEDKTGDLSRKRAVERVPPFGK